MPPPGSAALAGTEFQKQTLGPAEPLGVTGEEGLGAVHRDAQVFAAQTVSGEPASTAPLGCELWLHWLLLVG